jgi:hypothetical protein
MALTLPGACLDPHPAPSDGRAGLQASPPGFRTARPHLGICGRRARGARRSSARFRAAVQNADRPIRAKPQRGQTSRTAESPPSSERLMASSASTQIGGANHALALFCRHATTSTACIRLRSRSCWNASPGNACSRRPGDEPQHARRRVGAHDRGLGNNGRAAAPFAPQARTSISTARQVDVQGGAWTNDGMRSGGCAGAKSQPWPSSQPAS